MKTKSCRQKKRIPKALRKVGIQKVTDNLKGRKLVVPAELIMAFFKEDLLGHFLARQHAKQNQNKEET